MRAPTSFVNVRPYLGIALVATAAVVLVPFALVLAWVAAPGNDPSFFTVVVVSSLLIAGAFVAGSVLWNRRPDSADISFGELMIWGWIQRRRADKRLVEGARLLGLDRDGTPEATVRVTPERQIAVLHELTAALESKDPYTHGHSERVARHVYRTAAAMGLSTSAIEELRMAAKLHDVGKVRVPDRILRKPTQLTIEERVIVEEHTIVGAWMVSSVSSSDVISAVRHHHERWDGAGYPDGISGTDIPLYARLIAVADAYDAITSTRPYRAGAGRERAVELLRAEAGSQFDPMIVTSFVDSLPVRLPVAGLVALFAGPGVLFRRLAVWLKRMGAGHLAPTAATMGAVLTLGSFVPGPPVERPTPAPAIAAPAAAPDDGESNGVRERRSATRERELEVVVRAHAPEETTPRDGDLVLNETLVRDAAPAPDPRPEPKPKPKPDPKREPDPKPTAQPEAPEPEEQPVEEDCAAEESQGEKNGKGHEKAKGEGHRKHCD